MHFGFRIARGVRDFRNTVASRSASSPAWRCIGRPLFFFRMPSRRNPDKSHILKKEDGIRERTNRRCRKKKGAYARRRRRKREKNGRTNGPCCDREKKKRIVVPRRWDFPLGAPPEFSFGGALFLWGVGVDKQKEKKEKGTRVWRRLFAHARSIQASVLSRWRKGRKKNGDDAFLLWVGCLFCDAASARVGRPSQRKGVTQEGKGGGTKQEAEEQRERASCPTHRRQRGSGENPSPTIRRQ